MPRTPTPWSSRRFRLKLAFLVVVAAIGAASTVYGSASAGMDRAAPVATESFIVR